jgi:hypothetical protein
MTEMTREHLYKRKRLLFRWMYEFTQSACTDCERTGCACKDSICGHVLEQAAKQGHRFTPAGNRLRCLGAGGCIVPPHLRETCTLYICESAMRAPGFPHRKYMRLKALCERVEWQLMTMEEEH